MKLLDEIVELLSSSAGSLTDALLKTKVLMHRIGQKELAAWVNAELQGYPGKATVPEYRIVPAMLVATLNSGQRTIDNYMMPVGHLDEHLKKEFTQQGLRESIRVLEQYAAQGAALRNPLPADLYQILGKTLQNAWVERAWIQMEATQVMNPLIEVRSRLLDFVLSLQGELDNVEDDGVKEASASIDVPAMFHHLVMGDNATLVVGNSNITTITNSVVKGDFSSLAAELRKNGVEQSDIADLQVAVTQDTTLVDLETKTFGPAVKSWMSKMMGKAIDASWQIELGVAGGLLTEALKAFYF